MLLPDSPDQRADIIIGISHVFASLENEGLKTESVSCVAAVENLFGGQPVSFSLAVGTSDAAVKTVVAAVVGELYKAAKIDVVAVIRYSGLLWILLLFDYAAAEDIVTVVYDYRLASGYSPLRLIEYDLN